MSDQAPTTAKLSEEAMKFLNSLIGYGSRHQVNLKLNRVFSHLVKINGRALSQHLGKVPTDRYPTPLLVRIINQSIKSLYSQSADAEGDPDTALPPSVDGGDKDITSAEESRIEAKVELLDIFKSLQTKKVRFPREAKQIF